ncbi:MAG TPA: PAS domain S-box protein [Sphingobacteriaceae bacterium]
MEKNLLSLFQSLPGLYLLLKSDSCNFTITAASRAYLTATAFSEKALLGRGLFEVFPVDLNDPNDEGISQLAESLSYVLEFKEAHTIPVLKYAFPHSGAGDTAGYWRVINTPHLNDAGEVEYIIHSVEDISATILTQQSSTGQLAADLQTQQYWYLFNNNPDAAFSFNKVGEFLSANNALAELLECSLEEIFENTFFPFVVPEDLDRTLHHFQEALNGLPQNYQITAVTAKGTRLPIQISNVPVIVDNQITGVFGIAKNITELVRSQEQFQSLVNTINGIVWEADPKTFKIKFVSSQAEKLLGYPVKHWIENPNFWVDNIHPDDRMRIAELWFELLPQKKSFDFEFRMIASDGQVLWLKDYITVIVENDELVSLRGIIVDITESKNIEKTLHESEEKYRNLIRNSLDGVYKSTPDGRFIEANPALVEMLGYDSLEELLSIDIKSELYFELSDRESALLEETQVEMAEFRMRRKDGSEIWVEDHGQLVIDEQGNTLYHEGIIRNITDRKKAEAELARSREALMRSNERFAYASRATADAIWDWDLKSGKVFREEKFASITGHSVEYINSDDYVFEEQIHPDDVPEVKRKIDEVLQGDTTQWAIEFRLRKADTTYAYVIDRGIIMRDTRGTAYRIIGAMQDISQQKQAECERERLIQTLIVNNKDLQQFSYITSHNLKAPLANMMSILGLLDSSRIDDEETLMLIDGISKSATQLNNTVDDLVRILVIKENVNIDQETVALEDTWRKVENLTSGLIKAADAEVSLNFNEAPEVYFNNTYLESILLNLFSNALKYRSDDRKCRIEISTQEADDHILLSVKDNGLGIDLHRYDKRIFGLYQRFHNHPDSRGLGLYIIASQIKALGGKIEVESKVNEGTCFKVYFKKIESEVEVEEFSN